MDMKEIESFIILNALNSKSVELYIVIYFFGLNFLAESNTVDYAQLLGTIHGHSPNIDDDSYLFYLDKQFQTHTHGNHCWPDGALSCKFRFPKRVVPFSFFDTATNQYHLMKGNKIK